MLNRARASMAEMWKTWPWALAFLIGFAIGYAVAFL